MASQSEVSMDEPTIRRMASLLALSATPLAGGSATEFRDGVLAALQETLRAPAAALLRWSPGAEAYGVVGQAGDLPGSDSALWQQLEFRQLRIARSALSIDLQTGEPGWVEALPAVGWGALLLAASHWREEDWLFLAARPVGASSFDDAERQMLETLAALAPVWLENARLFEGASTAVRRMEGADGALALASRMEVLQRLLPGLLREINTPMQGIKNGLTLAERGAGAPDRIRSYLGTAQQELYRMEAILQRIASLAGPAALPEGVEVESTEVDLAQVVTQVTGLLQNLLKEHNIQVRMNVSRPLPGVCTHRDLVEQVITHLFLNAIDALESIDGERTIWLDVNASAAGVQLNVEDSGAGIAPEMAGRLFRPFASSKPQAAGLGLAASLRAVQAMGGALALEAPTHGGGACFVLRLPVEPSG